MRSKLKKCFPLFLVIFIIFAVFYRFEFNGQMPNFSGEDSFYNVGIARYIIEHGIPHEFPYLYYTILHSNFVDHEILFHLLLIPFIAVFGEFIGPKLMIISFVALNFGFLYLIFKDHKLKFALPFALISFFILPSDFYYRMAFIRVGAVSLFFMVLALYLIFKQKPVLLALFSYLFVWLYGGFVFMLVLALTYIFAALLANEKVNYKIPAAIFSGTLLGLIINPYFPHNFLFLWVQIFQTGLGAKEYSGVEWRPYDTWRWFTLSLMSVILFFGGLLIALIKKEKSNYKELMVIFFSTFLLFLQWKSRRYVEYWPFWAVLTGFIIAGPYFEEKILNFALDSKKLKDWSVIIILLLLIPFTAAYSYSQITRGYSNTKASFDLDQAKEANDILKQESKKGDIVFTDDWDVFPYYFFLNQKDNYIVGLDPEFMNDYNSSLYQEFAGISSGNDSSKLERIKNDFNAKWVLVAKDHQKLKKNLEESTGLFKKIFQNDEYTLFQVLD